MSSMRSSLQNMASSKLAVVIVRRNENDQEVDNLKVRVKVSAPLNKLFEVCVKRYGLEKKQWLFVYDTRRGQRCLPPLPSHGASDSPPADARRGPGSPPRPRRHCPSVSPLPRAAPGFPQ